MDTTLTALRNSADSDSNRLWSEQAILEAIFSVTQETLDNEDLEVGSGPILRMVLVDGSQTLLPSKFTLEGENLMIYSFLAFFKRCALLWKLLLNKGCINKQYSQRLLLKLDYTQKLTSKIFSEANVDIKALLGGNVDANITILDLCVSVLQLQPGKSNRVKV